MVLPTLLIPILGLAAALLFVFAQKRRVGEASANAGADRSAEAIAERLGLTVVEGDPRVNLLREMPPARERRPRVRMRGVPYEHPVELDFVDGYEITRDVNVDREAAVTFRCLLSIDVDVPFSDFEVTLRNPGRHLAPRRLLTRCGEAALQPPQLDAAFRLATDDPRVVAILAPVLPLLAGQSFVHVLGRRGRVVTFVPRTALACFARAPEEHLLALESVACALEGRPLPAQAPVLLASA